MNHIHLIIPESHSHLIPLYIFQGGFKSNHKQQIKRRLPASTATDMLWWKDKLKEEFIGMRILHPPKPLEMSLFVDTSTTWGIRLILDGKWLAWQFREGWNFNSHEISWEEMVAVEMAVHTLISVKFNNCHMVICSDNMGVIGALGTGKSCGVQQNLILHEIIRLIQDNNLWISTFWISTLNNPADRPSRGIFPKKNLLCAFPPSTIDPTSGEFQ